MRSELNLQSFDKHVGEIFDIDFGDTGTIGATLTEAIASKGQSKNREPFSLVFQCPPPAPPQQGLYRISHAEMGEIDLFLVPIHGDDEGIVFEAVFN